MHFLRTILSKSRWTVLSSCIFLILQTITFLIIPRYVSTVDLGSFAISSALVFMGLTIIEYAFPTSLIHSDQVSKEDYTAVLVLNFKTSIITAVIALVVVTGIGLYQQQYVMIYLLVGLLPLLFLSSVLSIHIAGLKRDLGFAKISMIEIVGHLTFFFSIITLLYFDCGVWSLVVAYIIKHLTMLFWLIINDWLYTDFKLHASSELKTKHLDYGKYIIGDKGISSIISYADTFVVGHVFGLHTLGIYDIIKKVVLRPVIVIYNALESVVFPLLTKEKHRPYHYNIIFRDFMCITRLVFIPVLFILFLGHNWVIHLFPPAYHEYTSTLAALCVLGMSIIIANPIDIILYSLGQTRTFFLWQCMTAVPLLIIMLVSCHVSLNIMIVSIGVYYVIIYMLSYFLVNQSGMSLRIRDYYIPVVFSLILVLLWTIMEKSDLTELYKKVTLGLLTLVISILEALRYLRYRD